MKIQSLLATFVLISTLHAQEGKKGGDPFRDDQTAVPPLTEAELPRNISVCHEAFSIPLALAAKLQRENKTDQELYAFLAGAPEKGEVRQESLNILRLKSGQKATVEGISEHIYPTEFEPATLPGTVGVAIAPPPVKDTPAAVPDAGKLKDAPALDEVSGLRTPATPTSFDTRNVGVTLEVEATMGEDMKDPLVDLRLAPERVTQAGRLSWGQGLNQTELPVFESQRITTGITVRVNKPVLIGTMNRPPVSSVDPDSANRVWFAFVTVAIVKP